MENQNNLPAVNRAIPAHVPERRQRMTNVEADRQALLNAQRWYRERMENRDVPAIERPLLSSQPSLQEPPLLSPLQRLISILFLLILIVYFFHYIFPTSMDSTSECCVSLNASTMGLCTAKEAPLLSDEL
jgi:hypothetical protein